LPDSTETNLELGHDSEITWFDTTFISMLVSGPSIIKSVLFNVVFGCPFVGENREAGENPARSRHCDENIL